MPTQNITLDGEVQDVGLRGLIAEIGETGGKRGYVFNEADGTVRVVMAGTRRQATEFVASIRERSVDLRAEIESVEVTEFDGDIDLPPFGILPTDDLADLGRKLDIGIRSLTGIEEHTAQISAAVGANTERLSSIEEDTGRLSSIEESTDRLSSIEENAALLPRIEENTARLPRIEEHTAKLVDGQERMIEILDERL